MSDCEIAQYYVTRDRLARKLHKCCECNAPIEPGEKYLQINGCWDYEPQVYRQHVLCQHACEFVRDAGLNNEECLYFGELKEWYSQSVDGTYEYEPTPEQRKKLFGFMIRIRRRERIWGRKNKEAIARSAQVYPE